LARNRFAVIALVALAIASSFSLLLDVVQARSQTMEETGVPFFEGRFAELRKALPNRGTVGFLTDLPSSDISSQAEYYLMQYELAPLIVKNTTDEKLVIGDVHNAKTTPAQFAPKGLVLEKDFGKGAQLYRNTRVK
jgi:hypothetical protein